MPKCHSRALDGGHVILRLLHINSGILPEYKMLWTIIVQLCNSVSVQLLYSSAFSSPADPMPFKHCWWNSHGTSSVISIIHLFLSPDFCVENNLAGLLLWIWPPFHFNILGFLAAAPVPLSWMPFSNWSYWLDWAGSQNTQLYGLSSLVVGSSLLCLRGTKKKSIKLKRDELFNWGLFSPTEQLKYDFKKD